jgi:hypothetical protein
MSVLAYLESKDRSATVMIKNAYDSAKNVTIEEFRAYKLFASVQPAPATTYHGSIGPGDVSVLPAGWFFVEKTNGSDVIGFRASFLTLASNEDLVSLNTLLLASQKPSDVLTRAVDCLALAS